MRRQGWDRNRFGEQARFGLPVRHAARQLQQAPGLQVLSSALEHELGKHSPESRDSQITQGDSVGREAKGHKAKSWLVGDANTQRAPETKPRDAVLQTPSLADAANCVTQTKLSFPHGTDTCLSVLRGQPHRLYRSRTARETSESDPFGEVS